MNSYFIPGYGITRVVLQRDIKYHLGPDTIVRPYIHQGRDGYLITTPGGPPTQAQIEDIQAASHKFEQQLAARSGSQAVDGNAGFVNQPVRIQQGRR